MAEGMLDLAREQARSWNRTLEATAEAERLREQRQERHYSIPSTVNVQVVDKEAHLESAFTVLCGASAVGLDVECSLFGKPALLQLATRECTYLLDLLKLGRSKVFGDHLLDLFTDGKVAKLVFGGRDDFQYLSKLEGLRGRKGIQVKPCVDMQKVAQKALAADGQVGLSKVTAHYLGRPLDKAMQASDWMARPLGEAQCHYAALDAWVLTELHERLIVGAERGK